MRRNLAVAVLLLLGCSNMLFRSGRDYFPLVRDSLWKYHDGTDTTYIQVGGDSLIGGRNATVLYTDFAPGFWLKPVPESEILRWTRDTLEYAGSRHIFGDRYALIYQLPLVTGNHWAETFDTTLASPGADTVNYRRRLEVRVAAVEAITVPAGSFEECYRLEFTETLIARTETSISYTEWLAPDVGLVRRVYEDREIELVEYRIGP